MLAPPVDIDIAACLPGKDHSEGGKWHSQGPPQHMGDALERTKVPPHAKDITEELTPFMEEYFWRVDNGTQKQLFETMFTPDGMYYNNGFKQIVHGAADAEHLDNAIPQRPWLKHQIDRMAICPTFDKDGPVLVHVLGSHWNGLRKTQDKAEQAIDIDARQNLPFSETFEVVKVEGQWKINRVILMMHMDLKVLLAKFGVHKGAPS